MSATNLLKQKLSQAFNKRMPHGDQTTLNYRSTYVLPTGSGLLLIGIILLMMIGATNYQNNLAFLLTFLVVGLGLVCMVLTVKNLQGIAINLLQVPEIYAHQHASIDIKLTSQQQQSHFSLAMGTDKQHLFLLDINHQIQQIKLPIGEFKRGYQSMPRLMICSEYPLGWLISWSYFRFTRQLLVYPQPLQPPGEKIQQPHFDLGQQTEQGKAISGTQDLNGLKNYQPGDNLSRVDWKAYARGAGLLSKEFVDYQHQPLCFSWQDYPQADQESMLGYLTYQVLQAAAKDLQYALLLPNKKIPLASGEQHRLTCLKALAIYGKDHGKNHVKSEKKFEHA